jgi:hypothetical protein
VLKDKRPHRPPVATEAFKRPNKAGWSLQPPHCPAKNVMCKRWDTLHSSELHVGSDGYEADVRLPLLRTRHVDTPSGNHAMEDEYSRKQLLHR